MKKILLICLVSLLCNIGIFSNVANAEETVSADSVNKVVYNENTDNEYWSKVDKDNIKNIILSLSKKDTN